MQQRTNSAAIAAYTTICLIWGTTYYAILKGLEEGFSPFIMGSIRFFIAGILILIIGLVKKKVVMNSMLIFQNLLIGVIMMGGGQGLIFWGEQYIPTGYAAILGASLPLWFVMLDGKKRKSYLNNRNILLGLILGFAGILMLFITQLTRGKMAGSTMAVYGGIAIIISCVCWVWGSLYFKNKFSDTDLLAGLHWQLFGGMLCCGFVAVFTKEWNGFEVAKVSGAAWFSVLYLAVAGSVIALMAYQWLLRQWPSAIVGTYAYINPVIAVLLGYFAAAETVSLIQVSGMIAVISAAVIVNKGRQQLDQ